jgi:hypothetical protein
MTVEELMSRLAMLPPGLPVMGSDYEDGMYDIERVDIAEPWGSYPRHVVLT